MLYFTLFFSCCLTAFSFSFAEVPIEPAKEESRVTVSFTYDDVVDIFERVENEGLEDYPEEHVDRVVQLFIFLSRLGVLPGEEDEQLEEDIKEMLGDDYDSYVCEVTLDNVGVTIQKILDGYR